MAQLEPIAKMVAQLSRLPGVGTKSAQRLAFYVLGLPRDQAAEFSQAILDAKDRVHTCPVCQNLTDQDLCDICADPQRDQSKICVVAEPKDVVAMERAREYHGVYHVLHGVISPLNQVGPDDLRIRNAYQEARKRGMEVQMVLSTQEMPHPNTARIRAEGANGLRIDMVGVSLGGAVIEVRQLNGMDVAFRCEYPTLLVFHQDQPGVIRQVTEVLENAQANIAFMRVFRNAKRKDACMIIETDDPIPPESIRAIQNLKPVIREVCTL